MYKIRERCVFCQEILKNTYFPKDYECFSGIYVVPLDYPFESMQKIPYNIYICGSCKTPQTKYLGDLNEIYRCNHGNCTGRIWKDLYILVEQMISKYKAQINNIIEIGSSNGVLADYLLSHMDQKTIYHIIEPTYWGSQHKQKRIIPNFYEDVDDRHIEANTIVISHVFEHFYEPITILKKICDNENIRHLFIVIPDLEYAINNQMLNVLNIEHTYYMDNAFLIHVFDLYGFHLVEKQNHENHSVLFYFEKRYPTRVENTAITFSNHNYSLDEYFNPIFQKIRYINDKIRETNFQSIYIWPTCVNTALLFILGLDKKLITGLLDNSIFKIGAKQYGTNLPIYSMKEKMNEDCMIFLNGGVFNSEIDNNSCKAHIETL